MNKDSRTSPKCFACLCVCVCVCINIYRISQFIDSFADKLDKIIDSFCS